MLASQKEDIHTNNQKTHRTTAQQTHTHTQCMIGNAVIFLGFQIWTSAFSVKKGPTRSAKVDQLKVPKNWFLSFYKRKKPQCSKFQVPVDTFVSGFQPVTINKGIADLPYLSASVPASRPPVMPPIAKMATAKDQSSATVSSSAASPDPDRAAVVSFINASIT